HRGCQHRPTQILAAGEAPYRKLRERIEHMAIATDGCGDCFTRERRDNYPLPGEATGIEQSGLDLPYERQARGRDRECPTPCMLDPRVLQLQKNMQQVFADPACDVIGELV